MSNRSTPRSLARVLVSLATLIAAVVPLACSSSTPPELRMARYEVVVSGESFVVEVTGDDVDDFEARLASGRTGVVSGDLARGTGGFNDGWSWHLVPSTVHAPEFAIEVCDGRPSFVEDDLAYWVDNLGQFCPWGARVVERLD